jgi:large subunit ribosomal protein L33
VRTAIHLECTKCKRRNYHTDKNKTTTPDRLKIKKYCKFCKEHTEHKEGR